MLRIVLVALLCTSVPALASTPMTLQQSGYLLDANDAPVDVTGQGMTFRIFSAVTGGPAIWTGACSVDVRSGYYAVSLGGGCGTGLDSTVLVPGSQRFLEIAIGATTLSPRVELGAVPVASEAAHAANADAIGGLQLGDLDLRYVGTTGTQSIGGAKTFTGPATFSGGLSGSGAGLSGVDAASVGGVSLTTLQNASSLNAGTLSDLRLSTNVGLLNGTQAWTGIPTFTDARGTFSGDGTGLALSASNLLSGTVPDARLAGTYSQAISLTNAGNAYAGGVVVNNSTAATPGAIRFDGTHFLGYNGSAWVSLDTQVVSSVTISGVSPATSTTAGGVTVTINGSGFTATPTVTFGSNAATSVTFVNSSQITCVAPAGTGTVSVTVMNPDGGSATAANAFTYWQAGGGLRIRAGSSYLARTPTTAGNRSTWTYSAWVKLGSYSGSEVVLFGASDTYLSIGTNSAWALGGNFRSAGTNYFVVSTQLLRDFGAWYHLVWAVDTTQATASNRVKLYVNGVQVSSFSATGYPAQNDQLHVNNTEVHNIGRYTAGSNLFDGYVSEVTFVDGQQLAPGVFGQNDATTGVWQPKRYTGTFGTNGFYLPFTDTSSTTNLAADKSGAGNHWTPFGVSLAGPTYDAMADSPVNATDSGNGHGNYPTLNPLAATGTLTNGNLDLAVATVNAQASTVYVNSGKWYWEAVWNAGAAMRLGVVNQAGQGADLGGTANGWCRLNAPSRVYNNGVTTAYGSDPAAGDVQMFALDVDSGKLWYGRNGVWDVSGNPNAGTNPSQTFAANQYLSPAASSGSGTVTYSMNFGQRPFTYAPPTGFQAINTHHLPTPAIKVPNQYFDATTYTGTGTTLSVANAGSFQPDLLWLKIRSTTGNPVIVDSSRGANKVFYPSQTTVEQTPTAGTGVLSLLSGGFQLGTDISGTSFGSTNLNGGAYVGWQWKKGVTPGFDIQTYTGDGTSNRAIAHGLGVAPSFIVVKDRTTGFNWDVYHRSIGIGATFTFDTSATRNVSAYGSTAPNATSFYTQNAYTNGNNGDSLVAYLFAEVPGFSKFGTYTGNNSADGPFVYTGFRPRWIMVRSTANARDWLFYDTARGLWNPQAEGPIQNSTNAPYPGIYQQLDVVSNGFKWRDNGSPNYNTTETYIYAAFAETPFKYALAR